MAAVVIVVLGAFLFLRDSGSKSPQEQADAAVLRLDDLPSQFSSDESSSSRSSDSDSGDAEKQQAEQCFSRASGLDPNAADKDQVAKSTSKFVSGSASAGNLVNIGGEVDFYEPVDGAVQQLHAISDPAVAGCIEDLFQATFAKEQVNVSNYTAAAPDLDTLGDDRGGFSASFTITGPSGRTAQVQFVEAVVKKGKAFASVELTTVGDTDVSSLTTDALNSMLDRLP